MALAPTLLVKEITNTELWKVSRKDLEKIRAEIQAFLKKNKSSKDEKIIFQIELVSSFVKELRLELKKTKAARLLIQLDNIPYSEFEDLEVVLEKIKRTSKSVFTTEAQIERLEKHNLELLDFLSEPDDDTIFARKIKSGFSFVFDE